MTTAKSVLRLQLREIATEQGTNISQIHLATGVNFGTVRRYWYNETSQVDLQIVSRIADALNVDPIRLFTTDPDLTDVEKGKLKASARRGRPSTKGKLETKRRISTSSW